MLNLAANLMIEQRDTNDKRQLLYDELHGRFRTMGKPIAPEDEHAPSWWHGDDEAYETTMAAVASLPQRRRR